MQRFISFDIAKAICIILVVIGHYVPDYSPQWYVGVHDVIYTFHIPLFMLLVVLFIWQRKRIFRIGISF